MGLDKSPMLRGIRLWDQIPQAVQRALTKVTFKIGMRHACATKMTVHNIQIALNPDYGTLSYALCDNAMNLILKLL